MNIIKVLLFQYHSLFVELQTASLGLLIGKRIGDLFARRSNRHHRGATAHHEAELTRRIGCAQRVGGVLDVLARIVEHEVDECVKALQHAHHLAAAGKLDHHLLRVE